MRAFYRDVVGLEEWREGDGFVFLKVAEGIEGHPQALVLFDRRRELQPETSTLDHVAFAIAPGEYESRRVQLEEHGLEPAAKEFPGFGWRALFVRDPDGNSVEFVCHDPSVGA